jgi:hypothetical protein
MISMNTEQEQKQMLAKLHDLKDRLTKDKISLEQDLVSLKTRIRIGGRLPDREYAEICCRQERVRSSVYKINTKLLDIKGQIRAISEQIFTQRGDSGYWSDDKILQEFGRAASIHDERAFCNLFRSIVFSAQRANAASPRP